MNAHLRQRLNGYFSLYTLLGIAFIGTGQQEALAVEGFTTVKVLQVGQAPHQIAFSQDGGTAYVAAAGSDKITIVDAVTFEIRGSIAAANTPLGIALLDREQSLAVSQFGGEGITLMQIASGAVQKTLETGGGSSTFSGPLAENQWLISSEKTNQISLIDGDDFEIVAQFDTGKRPFPAAATADGRRVFVPNYDDGTVTVINLKSGKTVATVNVGSNPSGGTVLPEEKSYAVAVRGENRVDLIDVASHRVIGHISNGIGESPFSVVTSPDGRFAFVNNTASHDVSVVDISEMRVIGRQPVGEIPIVMAVHPDGGTLWVACEGSHKLHVIKIPPAAGS